MEQTVSVDLQQLEEKYGKDFAEEIKEHVEYCQENSLNYKLEVIEEYEPTIHLVFATRAYCEIYEVSKNRKKISNKTFIGKNPARDVLKIMEGIN